MRPVSTWVISGAVLVLAVLAIADAIRSHEGAATSRPPVQDGGSLHGILLLADDECRTAAIHLPSMAPAVPDHQLDCGGRVWSNDGTLSATCHGAQGEAENAPSRDARTTVVSADGHIQFGDFRGCAPAWRPDGALSLVRDGEIVVVRRHGPEQVFFTREQLAAALRSVVSRPATYAFSDVRWFGLSSFVAIVQGARSWDTAAAVFAQGSLESFVPQFGRYIEGLQASPLGNFAFARTVTTDKGPVREYVMVSRGGDEIRIPRIENARAIAWSPDESRVAIATQTAIFIGLRGAMEPSTRIPRGATALGWVAG